MQDKNAKEIIDYLNLIKWGIGISVSLFIANVTIFGIVIKILRDIIKKSEQEIERIEKKIHDKIADIFLFIQNDLERKGHDLNEVFIRLRENEKSTIESKKDIEYIKIKCDERHKE